MRVCASSLCGMALLLLGGCKSAFIATTISNHTGQTIDLIEVDYPTASFGKTGLAAGADFHYRFKVLGDGGTTLLWTDAEHHDHKLAGPNLHPGDEGRMTIVFGPSGPPVWKMDVKQR